MDGYCSKCGRYGQLLAKLADGTSIYRCFECERVWGERLVVFDVSYALSEHKAGNGHPAEENITATVSEPSTA